MKSVQVVTVIAVLSTLCVVLVSAKIKPKMTSEIPSNWARPQYLPETSPEVAILNGKMAVARGNSQLRANQRGDDDSFMNVKYIDEVEKSILLEEKATDSQAPRRKQQRPQGQPIPEIMQGLDYPGFASYNQQREFINPTTDFPISTYSDGTNYPMDMKHYDHFEAAPAAAPAAAAAAPAK